MDLTQKNIMNILQNISALPNRSLGRVKHLTIVWMAIVISLMLAFPSSALAETLAPGTTPLEQTSQTSELTAPNAPKSVSAASLFTKNCAGCHANGGNVVRRSKTLKQKALKRYGYDNVTKVSQIITNGKGVMSGYGDRLTSEEIGAIALYVKEQAESGW